MREGHPQLPRLQPMRPKLIGAPCEMKEPGVQSCFVEVFLTRVACNILGRIKASGRRPREKGVAVFALAGANRDRDHPQCSRRTHGRSISDAELDTCRARPCCALRLASGVCRCSRILLLIHPMAPSGGVVSPDSTNRFRGNPSRAPAECVH